MLSPEMLNLNGADAKEGVAPQRESSEMMSPSCQNRRQHAHSV